MATFDVVIPAGTRLYMPIADRDACVHLQDMRDRLGNGALFYTNPYFAIHDVIERDEDEPVENWQPQIAEYVLLAPLTARLGLVQGPGEGFDRTFFEPNSTPTGFWSDTLEADASRTNGYVYILYEQCTRRALRLLAVYTLANDAQYRTFAATLVQLNDAQLDDPAVFDGFRWYPWRDVVYSVYPHVIAGVLRHKRCGQAPNRQDPDNPFIGLPPVPPLVGLPPAPPLEGGTNSTYSSTALFGVRRI